MALSPSFYKHIKAQGREHNSLANLTENDFVNNIIRPEDGQNMRNFTQEYQYDEIGNLLQMKSNGVWTRDYRYNFTNNNYLLDHDLQGTTDIYEYDTHGNMSKMPHLQELFWDYTDNLKEVTLDASNNKAYYVYDTNGDRIRKVVVKNSGTIVEDRFYLGDHEIYSKKTNGTIDVERETLHLIDDKSKVALIDYDTQTQTSTIRYQYTNHLDSASLELDETGDIISYEEYHPFGTTSYRSGRNEIDVSLKRYKYVHKELDNETGLYYYGMRYYAPWMARFISVDPLQFDYPIYTPYQYAGNMPITFKDLDGAEPWKPDKGTPRHYKLNYQLEDEVYSIDIIGGRIKSIPNKLKKATKVSETERGHMSTIPKRGKFVQVYIEDILRSTDGGRGSVRDIEVGQDFQKEFIRTREVIVGTIPAVPSQSRKVNPYTKFSPGTGNEFPGTYQGATVNQVVNEVALRLGIQMADTNTQDAIDTQHIYQYTSILIKSRVQHPDQASIDNMLTNLTGGLNVTFQTTNEVFNEDMIDVEFGVNQIRPAQKGKPAQDIKKEEKYKVTETIPAIKIIKQ